MPGKRTKKAKVWLYFTNLVGEGRSNFCQKVIKAKGGMTSNMIKYLTTVHKDKVKLNELNVSKVSENQYVFSTFVYTRSLLLDTVLF